MLSRAVALGQKRVKEGERDAAALIAAMKALIEAEPLARIDYVEAVDGVTMEPVSELTGGVLVAMAVYVGAARLLDNFTVGDNTPVCADSTPA